MPLDCSGKPKGPTGQAGGIEEEKRRTPTERRGTLGAGWRLKKNETERRGTLGAGLRDETGGWREEEEEDSGRRQWKNARDWRGTLKKV